MSFQQQPDFGAEMTRKFPLVSLSIWTLSVVGILVSGCGDAKPSPPKDTAKPSVEPAAISSSSPPDVIDSTDDVPTTPSLQPTVAATPPEFDPVAPPIASANFRRPDTRPVRDSAQLASVGIHKYESKHLLLYTDIAPEIARELPGLVDALYPVWERYFSPLPPDRDGKPFQITGYLMKDRDLFRQMGLLPEDLPKFLNGRHRDREFWMNEQEFDYYRRHLMLHEATHCFMSVRRNNSLLPPVWYMEGMAEFFATHARDEQGKLIFGVMPSNADGFAGLGRISLIQQEVETGRFHELRDVLELTPNDFLKNEAYAWSWGLCYWLDQHPQYATRFRELGQTKSRPEFLEQFEKKFLNDAELMAVGWGLFATELVDGYDVQRAAIVEKPAEQIADANPLNSTVQADRGWQATGIEVKRGTVYEIRSTGRVTLAQEPKPWVSEPGGITVDYFQGQPLGRLLLAVRDQTPGLQGVADGLLAPIPIGLQATFTAPVDGTIYLRVNDRWNRLSDNLGSYSVTVQTIEE